MKRAFAVFIVLFMSTIWVGDSYGGPSYDNDCPPPFLKKDPPPDTSLKEQFKLILEKTACLVHGIDARYVDQALTNQYLSSAYVLKGPNGNYTKTGDLDCGGALGVYTRAVGAKQVKWIAKGYGNGSGENKVQLVLSPAILLDRYGAWRHTGFDNKGCPGGMSQIKRESGKDTQDYWEMQSESDRNKSYDSTVKEESFSELNEQLIWNRVELRGILKAIVCKDIQSYNLIMKYPDGTTFTRPNKGIIKRGSYTIPVILANPTDSLLKILEICGVAEVKDTIIIKNKTEYKVKEYRVR